MEGCATIGAARPHHGVATKLNAAAASVTLASAVVYEPMANLVKSMVYGNGLNDFNAFTLDDELDVLGTYSFAGASLTRRRNQRHQPRAHPLGCDLNLTNIFDAKTKLVSKKLLLRLRATKEWGYVEREADLRLAR